MLEEAALVALVRTESVTTEFEPDAAAGTTGLTRLQKGFAKAETQAGLDKTGAAATEGAKGVAEDATTEPGVGGAADAADDDPARPREGISTVLDRGIIDLPVQISNTGAALDD